MVSRVAAGQYFFTICDVPSSDPSSTTMISGTIVPALRAFRHFMSQGRQFLAGRTAVTSFIPSDATSAFNISLLSAYPAYRKEAKPRFLFFSGVVFPLQEALPGAPGRFPHISPAKEKDLPEQILCFLSYL
jgi:hypothetical protein